MRSNKSSRRGFFGKALACLGAAFAWPKSAAANLSYLTAPAGPAPLTPDAMQTYTVYDTDGQLIAENVVPAYSHCHWASYDSNGLVQGITDDAVGDGNSVWVQSGEPL